MRDLWRSIPFNFKDIYSIVASIIATTLITYIDKLEFKISNLDEFSGTAIIFYLLFVFSIKLIIFMSLVPIHLHKK